MRGDNTYFMIGGILDNNSKCNGTEKDKLEYKNCTICASVESVMEFKDCYICMDCIETVKNDIK